MAFWAQGSSVSKAASRPSAGPARPLSYVLGTGSGSLLEFVTLVRLRVDVPTAAAALAAAAEDVDDETAAAEVQQNAVCAIGQLHEVIRGIEGKAEDARVSAVLEVMQDRTLQLLCSKTIVAKVYKSLLPHQASVGFTMAPAKACLSQKAVAAWDLEESLQTAVVKTLTGCSSGTPSYTNSTTPTAPGHQAAASGQPHSWMCLSRRKLAGTNLLTAAPGEVSTAAFVDLEVKHDAGNKGLLLIVHCAGTVKFRLFSPCQALQQEAKSIKPPLTLDDSDTDLLSDPTKLAAAARQLEGRAVKLLPYERLVFIKGLTAAPTDPQQLQRITQYWLGCYGLLLSPSFPFLVGVATHPEAEAAQMQVPSCCVLTNLGLSTLPGSHPGGGCHAAAVSRLVSDLQAGAVGYSFWGNKLTVQLKDSSHAGTGLSQANLQLTQASQPAAGAAAAAVQPKAYSLQNAWTSASELSKLQAQASKQPRQQQQRELTAAEVQLMGLVEADGALESLGAGTQDGGSRQQGQRGASSNSSADKERWAGLKAYLAERKKQEDAQKVAVSGVSGIAAPAVAGGGMFSSARALGSNKPAPAAGAGATAVRTAAAAAGGAPAAPRFGSRKPGTSKPPAAAAAKPAGIKKPGLSRKVIAGLQAAQVEAETAAAAVAADPPDPAAAAAVPAPAAPKLAPAVASKPAAPSFGKRPAAADAAGKPPAAKKAKTAAAGAAAGGTAAKAKAPKKPKAVAAAGTAGAAANPAAAAAGTDPAGTPAAAATGNAAAGAAGEGTGSQQPAAEQQHEKKKRTKAADLDLAAVTAKVQAAYAASGGAALKGVSVPEMQCYLRAQGVKGGSAKRADVEARLLGLLAGKPATS